MAEHYNVVIIGAGLSGICAAHYLQERCPQKSFVILEARPALGGTWDLFRYPGIRSDSDLYTFGFSFRPWSGKHSIVEGSAILQYLHETAGADGTDDKIRYESSVVRAEWDSTTARWTLGVAVPGASEPVEYTCDFLYACTGYYDFAKGYMPGWPGMESFRGTIVHPQQWPEDLDYTGKRVVVIGSGATAVTLVPALAEKAEHVTMLQRSPTYVVSLPARDRLARALHRILPRAVAGALARWKNILGSLAFFALSKSRPDFVKKLISHAARAQLPKDVDVDTHFNPRYNPWDQRICLVPDGDLFAVLRDGRADVVTDTIARFTETGVELDSGRTLDADVIVTATGLNLRLMGGIDVVVDSQPVDIAQHVLYKGMMLNDLPNFAYSVGYTNASWTLKCELIARYVCRLLNYMRDRNYRVVVPKLNEAYESQPAIDLKSGYVTRALARIPRQIAKKPWRLHQNYALDTLALRYAGLEDGAITFSRG